MASILKRKRGAVEVKDAPKRAKSAKKNGKDVEEKGKENGGWEKALKDTTDGKELVKVNGEVPLMNGFAIVSTTPETKDGNVQKKEPAKKSKARGEAAAGKPVEKVSLWKLSESIGGRMSNLEPVFTAEEK
jgi:hypothetical protein